MPSSSSPSIPRSSEGRIGGKCFYFYLTSLLCYSFPRLPTFEGCNTSFVLICKVFSSFPQLSSGLIFGLIWVSIDLLQPKICTVLSRKTCSGPNHHPNTVCSIFMRAGPTFYFPWQTLSLPKIPVLTSPDLAVRTHSWPAQTSPQNPQNSCGKETFSLGRDSAPG